MSDFYDKTESMDYNVDYRNLYDNGKNSIKVKGVSSRGIVGNSEKNSYIVRTREVKNVVDSTFPNEDNVDELLSEIFKLIKTSSRVLMTVFIILLCVGLVAVTVNIVNENTGDIEKNHLPYTLLCMFKEGGRNNTD